MSNDGAVQNNSGNRPFQDVLTANQSRRKILMGDVGTAATSFFSAPEQAQADRESFTRAGGLQNSSWESNLINFSPLPVEGGGGTWPRISDDYQFDVLIPWGKPLVPSGPEFVYPPNSVNQTQQIGIGHDGMTFFPMRNPSSKDMQPFHSHCKQANNNGLLVINHEFGSNFHVLGKPAPESLEDVRTSQHAHGISVVEIAKVGAQWQTVESNYARRIHVNTPVTFSGPVADSSLLQTPAGNKPLGTVNNCGNGHTPWGTYLSCEENFNGYFGSTGGRRDREGFGGNCLGDHSGGDGCCDRDNDRDRNCRNWTPTEAQDRYGLSEDGFGYDWHKFDPRFDLANGNYQNEENRFGWVIEIDPKAPWKMPVKRTALGRFKHEGIAITEGNGGRIVAYMGDDQCSDYIYKFISEDSWKNMRARGQSPLDYGRLYVARFNDNGCGEWLELSLGDPAIAAKFSNQAEVLTYARLAADALGATPMERPEWITVAPGGEVYCTLANRSRTLFSDPAIPKGAGSDGHIIKWQDSENHLGMTFEWEIFLIAEDSHGTAATFSDPEGLWADPDGRLFIETDGGQQCGLNNQLLVADTFTGEVRRLFEGVKGDEVTGLTVTPDRRTLFCNLQHPGHGDPRFCNFPARFDGVTIPRDATIVITRKDGGIIGS